MICSKKVKKEVKKLYWLVLKHKMFTPLLCFKNLSLLIRTCPRYGISIAVQPLWTTR